jgi:hypothetical protein
MFEFANYINYVSVQCRYLVICFSTYSPVNIYMIYPEQIATKGFFVLNCSLCHKQLQKKIAQNRTTGNGSNCILNFW